MLEKFYNKLQDNLIKRYGKEKYSSVLVWFFDIKSNDRFRLLKDAALKKDDIDEDNLKDLLTKKFIREVDIRNEYAITGLGIWEIEKVRNTIITENTLIDSIDLKFFNISKISEKSLSDKYKVLLFSMIAARAFTDKSPVDLKMDEIALMTWERIIVKSFELLKKYKFINKLTMDTLFGKQGNEHKVSHVFRHTDELPKQTKGIFKAGGNQKYYLDIKQNNNKIFKDDLIYLFQQIFSKKVLSIDERNDVINLCDEIATTQNIYIFDINSHIFHKPEYSIIIKDSLLEM